MRMLGNMVRHQHAVIAYIPQGFDYLIKVHVTVVGIDFLKIVPASFDIAQMDIENLVPFSYPFDDGQDFCFGILQPFSSGTQTKIEAMGFTVIKLSKPLDTLKNIRAVPSGDSSITNRGWGIGYMVAQLHFIFFGYRKNSVQQIGDALVNLINGNIPCNRFFFIQSSFNRFLVIPGTVGGISSGGVNSTPRPQYRMDSAIIKQQVDTTLSGYFDHLLDH